MDSAISASSNPYSAGEPFAQTSLLVKELGLLVVEGVLIGKEYQ